MLADYVVLMTLKYNEDDYWKGKGYIYGLLQHILLLSSLDLPKDMLVNNLKELAILEGKKITLLVSLK